LNTIDVAWENQSSKWWNEICYKIIEQFGLPGDRYDSYPHEDYMRFVFKNEKDAFMCRLLISEAL
jgi:hypothetical protein